MGTFLRKLFESYARRLIIGGGKGIKQIPNKDRVRLMADNIYKDLKAAGVTDDMIRSEIDIRNLHHQVAEMNDQAISRKFKDLMDESTFFNQKKSGDVLDMTGKKIHPDETIVGGKGYKIETEAEKKAELDKLLGPGDDVFGSPIKDWHMKKFKKPPKAKDVTPIKETEAQIKLRLEAENKATIQKMRLKKLRKDVLNEIENRKKEDYIGDIIDPEDYGFSLSDDTWTDEVEELMQMLIRDNKAGGGRTGSGLNYLLGEDDQNTRVPYGKGKNVTAADIRRQEREELAEKITKYIKPQILKDEHGNIIPTFSKTGKQQIEGAPGGITSDKEIFNLVVGLDIPITEKINILGDIGFHKSRDKIEYEGNEIYLDDPASSINKNIGIGYNQGNNGFSGSFMYNPDTDAKDVMFKWSKKFNEGGRVPFGLGGGFNAARRAFLKIMGGTAAGVGVAKSGLFSLLKSGKPVSKVLTQVPIKSGLQACHRGSSLL